MTFYRKIKKNNSKTDIQKEEGNRTSTNKTIGAELKSINEERERAFAEKKEER